jgi:hypothetical protein
MPRVRAAKDSNQSFTVHALVVRAKLSGSLDAMLDIVSSLACSCACDARSL